MHSEIDTERLRAFLGKHGGEMSFTLSDGAWIVKYRVLKEPSRADPNRLQTYGRNIAGGNLGLLVQEMIRGVERAIGD